MRKHTIIAYTLQAGDTLYYLDHNEVKSITLNTEHVKRNIDSRTIPLAILDDLVIQPGTKVQQKKNGQLILWQAYKTSSGIGMGYSERINYYPKDSRLFADKELFDKYVEKKLKK
jgi:hypothetical protein